MNYLKNIFLNNCCYHCNFAGNDYGSDLILGDFWGIDKIDKNFYDKFGTSVCFCLTENAQKLFNQIKDTFVSKEFNNYKDIIYHNRCIVGTNYGQNKEISQELFYLNNKDGMSFKDNIDNISKLNPTKKPSLIKRVLRKIKRILFKK